MRLVQVPRFIILLAVSLGAELSCGFSQIRSDLFPEPSTIREQVVFWRAIFERYSSHHIVVHDASSPAAIVDVINLKTPPKLAGMERMNAEQRKSALSRAYLQRYELALQRFKKHGLSAVRFGSIEKRIHEVYKVNPTHLRRLIRGKVHLRTQAGLADIFLMASLRAQQYLPYMERSFQRYGVPEVVTRLAFVESMFQSNAVSKAGASGIWQFMPSTGRLFLTINKLVDERNNPYKAGRAAARLLAQNYKKLGSWPLAITAYNHGSAGIKRAVAAVGSQDIETIVQRYRSRSFGFASRNFYSEFLAAAQAYDALKNSKRFVEASYPRVSSLVLEKSWSVGRIVRELGIPLGILRKYNLCLNKKTFTHFSRRHLPDKFEVFMPNNLLPRTRKRLARREYSQKTTKWN